MVDLSSYKKAELLSVAHKVNVAANSKDTKKTLIEKIEAYISEAGTTGEELVEAGLEATDDDSEDDASTLIDPQPKETEEDDEEYKGPPIDVLKYFDPIIKCAEEKYQKVLEFTDKVGITTLEYNDELRENLSGTITLNYIELIFEFTYFIYTFVPLVAIKDNASIHPYLKNLIPFLSDITLKIPDLTYLFNFKVLSIALNWGAYAVLLPLLLSFYFNFSRRTILVDEDTSVLLRIYKYDPFIFALSKVLIFFFITYNTGSLSVWSSYSSLFKALQTHFLIQLGFYKEYTLLLGNFPLVLGIANVVIGLYAQFEDF
ncbi:hypothetical protein PSN45_000947 [Yamadazyma tenuis]|uniref:Uncharacterized protein n=1 Tax=Candida tenuis (strain ATCC 10573 / BCRC 21748 / CBS 615 / JCM 9827 / NBRC 10315 / NRRL Y-1498 / VKM Y-70) TaxID=590646 RepID=G3BBS3_CANTC|nr:uncharacterized protein CANTEDRAFT_115689 [Yamadazyma tenuis ATCC 10573]XP_006688993.1 uncharacterized protein CANTEDRAFT_115689 [Yamadazyma tenuis ATCC 10573]EGV62822.1 hypothetical protein CANTEDRAFT_115689 [Yamadazyma tenuis ATCC 10573]EGV62823.1 hypothetical protein CANTEDRAFT_115689 [Yamadazyma tenuis ATCC 10573]WEJ93483.1 hypothetical protein PSN45_000947 [Yamadazyma tenuis]